MVIVIKLLILSLEIVYTGCEALLCFALLCKQAGKQASEASIIKKKIKLKIK